MPRYMKIFDRGNSGEYTFIQDTAKHSLSDVHRGTLHTCAHIQKCNNNNEKK